MDNTLIIVVAVAAFIGGIASALLAWAKSTPPEPWNGRVAATVVVSALIGAAVVATGFNFSGVTNFIAAGLLAFLSGGGWTAGVSRVGGVIVATMKRAK
jgi:hypothetical protein